MLVKGCCVASVYALNKPSETTFKSMLTYWTLEKITIVFQVRFEGHMVGILANEITEN